MIIKLLLDLVYSIFNILTLPINIPDLPQEINSVIATIIEYVGTGLAILQNYTHLSYLRKCSVHLFFVSGLCSVFYPFLFPCSSLFSSSVPLFFSVLFAYFPTSCT